MKKRILFSIVFGLGFFMLADNAKAQHFQIVASVGTTQHWAVPNAILYEIDYYYPYHQIVHINRIRRGRFFHFNVLLENYGHFVELNFGRHAQIIQARQVLSYPLVQHVCNIHCGFHGDFYYNNRVIFSQGFYSGNHHIAYRPVYQRPAQYAHYGKAAQTPSSRSVNSHRAVRTNEVRNRRTQPAIHRVRTVQNSNNTVRTSSENPSRVSQSRNSDRVAQNKNTDSVSQSRNSGRKAAVQTQRPTARSSRSN